MPLPLHRRRAALTFQGILDAVWEAVSIEAAERMADMKKQDMAEAAEQFVVAIGWLPALMQTPGAVPKRADPPQTEPVRGTDAYSVAAE